jgi:hypothetical protein
MAYTSHKNLETNIITQGDAQEIQLDKYESHHFM